MCSLGMQINDLPTCLNSHAHLHWLIPYCYETQNRGEKKLYKRDVLHIIQKYSLKKSFVLYDDLSFGVVTRP